MVDQNGQSDNTFRVRFKRYEDKKHSTLYYECGPDGVMISKDDWRNQEHGGLYFKKYNPLGKKAPEYIEMTITEWSPPK